MGADSSRPALTPFTVRSVSSVRDLPSVGGPGGLGGDVGIVRRLSARGVPTYLERADAPDGGPHLIVVERLARSPGISDEQAEEWVRDARLASELEHENVLRTRAI